MKLVVLGLSITSSWGNGHATTYRGLLRELTRRGHEVLFLERDVPWYAAHRDLPNPVFCATRLYPDLDELQRDYAGAVAEADAVILGSYVPDGAEVGDWSVPDRARACKAFYDIDTPVTLAKLGRGEHEYLTPELIPRFDLYLSFTGGPTLDRLEEEFGAPWPARSTARSTSGSTGRSDAELRWDLGYLGTYSDDRQPKLEPAAARAGRATCAGAGSSSPARSTPTTVRWPANVSRLEHLAPPAHPGFYAAQRFTLNVTRADMVAAGWSPSVRLFEAASCGVPIISDTWPGLDELFRPDVEILLAEDGEDVVLLHPRHADWRRQAIAAAARRAGAGGALLGGARGGTRRFAAVAAVRRSGGASAPPADQQRRGRPCGQEWSAAGAGYRRSRVHRLAPVRGAARPRLRRDLPRQLPDRRLANRRASRRRPGVQADRGRHHAAAAGTPDRRPDLQSRLRRLAPGRTSAIRSTPGRPACSARCICWSGPRPAVRSSCRRRPARSMATPMCTRRRRATGATSIRSVRAPATTRASAPPRPCSSTLHRTRGVRIKVARIFNTYGPRMHAEDGRIISNFVAQALRGEALTVYGDGRQTRSFCYVDDMVRALLALADSGDGVVGPVNLGNPDELPVIEVARRVLAQTRSHAGIEFHPLPVDDPRRRRPAIDRALSLLGWRPLVDLDTGLARTVADFKVRLGIAAPVPAAAVVLRATRNAPELQPL